MLLLDVLMGVWLLEVFLTCTVMCAAVVWGGYSSSHLWSCRGLGRVFFQPFVELLLFFKIV